jgi:hypothetical protein
MGGKALRRTRRRNCTIWKRQPLVVIPQRGTILDEGRNGRPDRAVKHFIIAARLGHEGALEYVKMNFQRGYVNKEDYEGPSVDTRPLWMQPKVSRGRKQKRLYRKDCSIE